MERVVPNALVRELRRGADEARCPMHIVEDFRNGVLGLAAVDHREDGVAAVEQRPDEVGVDGLV